MEEPDICRLRVIEQAQRAASELGRGHSRGASVVPSSTVQRATDRNWNLLGGDDRRKLDDKEWPIGLLTLAPRAPQESKVLPR